MIAIITISLLLLLMMFDPAHAKEPPIQTFTSYTDPLPLHPGQITNSWHKIVLPTGPIAVYSFEADIVSKTKKGKVIPVPISDAYLHHHVIYSNYSSSSSSLTTTHRHHGHHSPPDKSDGIAHNVGFGAGTESRGTPQQFPYPYAFLTVDGEDEWTANVHVINTRGMEREKAYRCVECPCHETSSKIDDEQGWGYCNRQLLGENNTSCAAESYVGGLRCCEDGDFCLDDDELDVEGPVSTYYLRYVITYSRVTRENKPLELAACCDASGDLEKEGNIEYDVPQCDYPGCVHALSTIQYLHGEASQDRFSETFNTTAEEETGPKIVDVVYAVGHLHRAGMEMSLYDDITGELICRSVPRYGKSDAETAGDNYVGDELGYIVAMTPCVFDPPLRMSTDHPLRVLSVYNATRGHTGVMGLFYIAISDVKVDDEALKVMARQSRRRAGAAGRVLFRLFFYCTIVSLAGFYMYRKYGQRLRYLIIPRDDTFVDYY